LHLVTSRLKILTNRNKITNNMLFRPPRRTFNEQRPLRAQFRTAVWKGLVARFFFRASEFNVPFFQAVLALQPEVGSRSVGNVGRSWRAAWLSLSELPDPLRAAWHTSSTFLWCARSVEIPAGISAAPLLSLLLAERDLLSSQPWTSTVWILLSSVLKETRNLPFPCSWRTPSTFRMKPKVLASFTMLS